MFMPVLLFNLYSMMVRDGCSMPTVEWKVSDKKNYACKL